MTAKDLDLNARQRHPGADPPDEGPYLPIDVLGGHGGGIQLAIFGAESRRMRGAHGGLRNGRHAPLDQAVEGTDQQPSPDIREATLESRGDFVRSYRHALLRKDRSGGYPAVHLHDGDSRFGASAHDRPLARGGPPRAG